MPSLSYARENRLKSSFLIRRTFREGVRLRGEHFSVYWQNMPEESRIRFAVVVGSKVSKKAVVRNRVKRLLREALRKCAAGFLGISGGRLVILTHRVPEPLTLAAVEKDLKECFSKFRV